MNAISSHDTKQKSLLVENCRTQLDKYAARGFVMNNLNLYSYKGQPWIPAMHICHELTVALTVSSAIPC